jgi:hypothetical protein
MSRSYTNRVVVRIPDSTGNRKQTPLYSLMDASTGQLVGQPYAAILPPSGGRAAFSPDGRTWGLLNARNGTVILDPVYVDVVDSGIGAPIGLLVQRTGLTGVLHRLRGAHHHGRAVFVSQVAHYRRYHLLP